LADFADGTLMHDVWQIEFKPNGLASSRAMRRKLDSAVAEHIEHRLLGPMRLKQILSRCLNVAAAAFRADCS